MIDAWFRLSEMMASSGPRQRFEQAAIGVETGGEQDRIVLVQELAQVSVPSSR